MPHVGDKIVGAVFFGHQLVAYLNHRRILATAIARLRAKLKYRPVVFELLPNDFPYGRFSNLQTNITVNNLELRLPVADQPGSDGGLVKSPAPKVVPAGYTLAPVWFEVRASTKTPRPVCSAMPIAGAREPKPRYGDTVTASDARGESSSRYAPA